MHDLRHRRKDAAVSGLANAPAPVGLFGIDEEGVVQRPDLVIDRARHQHEHAGHHVDLTLGFAVPVAVERLAKAADQRAKARQAQFDDGLIDRPRIGKAGALDDPWPLQHLTADTAHPRMLPKPCQHGVDRPVQNDRIGVQQQQVRPPRDCQPLIVRRRKAAVVAIRDQHDVRKGCPHHRGRSVRTVVVDDDDFGR